tara:strand:+ start:12428 stop:12604 length:177 start_codon:yes stop_codon:yes gene_type:complete
VKISFNEALFLLKYFVIKEGLHSLQILGAGVKKGKFLNANGTGRIHVVAKKLAREICE